MIDDTMMPDNHRGFPPKPHMTRTLIITFRHRAS